MIKKIALSEIVKPAALVVISSASLAEVLDKMSLAQTDHSVVDCAVVVDNQNLPIGILTIRLLLKYLSRSPDSLLTQVVDVMEKHPLLAHQNMDVSEGYALLRRHDAQYLVVVDDVGCLVGVLDRLVFLQSINESNALIREELLLLANERVLFKLHNAALQYSPNPVVVTDINAVVMWVNPAFSELTGYAVDEVVGRQMDELVHSGKQDSWFYESLWETILSGKVWRGEMFNRRKDGSLYHQELVITPVSVHDDDVITHFIAVKQDITKYKEYEEQLREAAALMENTHEGVMITDASSNIIAVNAAYSRITGYCAEEVIGKSPSTFIAGRSDRWLFDKMWQNLQRDGSWQGEVWNRRKSGEVFPQLLTVSTVYNEQNKPIRYIGIFADISQIKKNQEQLEFMAHHDHLTKLPNRSWIEIRLKQEVERATRQSYNGGVLFIDLDRFKPVNDSFGHEVGDELLQAAVQRLNTRLRKGDTLGRLNGDEFILLIFPLRDVQDMAVIARDIISTLSTPFMLSCESEIFISASVGISLFPQDGDNSVELMKNADAAMYLAKGNGGNQFSFYSKELNASARSRLAMENDLRRALAQNELTLHYQPKVDLHTGKICGAEALARWPLPSGGMVSPGEFIPIAEKSNLILTLGSWLIEQACWQMRSWLDEGHQDIYVAINISARQFRSGNLDILLENALKKYRIDPRHLELELTESMLMQEPELAVETMHKLKKIGVQISLDDFGTGYSSLAYLSRFPIDTLKIDQSFVKNLTTDATAGEIAMSIIDLAHRMNLNVIAEGVETEAQLAYLRRNNCDEIQGYYFSKPLPANVFSDMLRSGKCLPRIEGENAASLLMVGKSCKHMQAVIGQLENVNYCSMFAETESVALELLALNAVQVLLVVQQLEDEIDSVAFLRKVKEIHKRTTCLLLVDSKADLSDLSKLVNEGVADKLLTSNINSEQLSQQIQDAFAVRRIGADSGGV